MNKKFDYHLFTRTYENRCFNISSLWYNDIEFLFHNDNNRITILKTFGVDKNGMITIDILLKNWIKENILKEYFKNV